MGYEKINWIDNQTPLSAANLNHMEAGIYDAQDTADTVNAVEGPAGIC